LDHLQNFFLSGQARPTSPTPSLAADQIEQFRGTSNRDEGPIAFSTDHPLTKAALLHLTEIRPALTTFQDLVKTARARLEAETDIRLEGDFVGEAETVGANLLGCYTQGLVGLHTYCPQLTTRLSERPLVSPVARLLAETRSENLPTLRHERVSLDQLDHYLVRQLDGSRDLSDLLAAVLNGPIADGTLKLEPAPPSPSAEAETTEAVIERELRLRLAWLARTGLLVQ
jgi:hypothetical protein